MVDDRKLRASVDAANDTMAAHADLCAACNNPLKNADQANSARAMNHFVRDTSGQDPPNRAKHPPTGMGIGHVAPETPKGLRPTHRAGGHGYNRP